MKIGSFVIGAEVITEHQEGLPIHFVDGETATHGCFGLLELDRFALDSLDKLLPNGLRMDLGLNGRIPGDRDGEADTEHWQQGKR